MKEEQTEKIPEYPLIVVCAKDWSHYGGSRSSEDEFNYVISWIAGWLIEEKDGKIVIAFEHITEQETNDIRDITVIPKENILIKRIIDKNNFYKLKI